jgi:ribosome-binding protein aMBF1 (putative translation factor)
MKVQIIQDSKGKKTGVYIPIQEWNELKKQYTELEAMEDKAMSKTQLIQELKQAITELTLIEAGKMKSRPAKALLREL